jgi:hypothetical protein
MHELFILQHNGPAGYCPFQQRAIRFPKRKAAWINGNRRPAATT